MKFGTEFQKRVLRACDHQEVFEFAYSNQRMRAEQEVRASRTICGTCRLAIQEMVANVALTPAQNEAMWLARLPELTGKPSQVAWAKSVRAKAGKFFFPLLDHVGTCDVMPGSAVRTVLRLLFSIQSSGFWIDAKADLMNQSWLVKEVEMLARNSDSFCAPVPVFSAYGYWKKARPDFIESARRAIKQKPRPAAAA